MLEATFESFGAHGVIPDIVTTEKFWIVLLAVVSRVRSETLYAHWLDQKGLHLLFAYFCSGLLVIINILYLVHGC